MAAPKSTSPKPTARWQITSIPHLRLLLIIELGIIVASGLLPKSPIGLIVNLLFLVAIPLFGLYSLVMGIINTRARRKGAALLNWAAFALSLFPILIIIFAIGLVAALS